ncbi:MAG TPA: bifunctional glutamate N-acetyltransferase/amino-acid acetyltransferase ArgJ [Gordonibacter urolithinfaciens]|uniref:bifunctional glutamate N-acetyltransferase/amino-acid acetyltransferase ArgJ n=1 Tax=Gordonibacter urolithinfaciens TaxID=1335613 RepID=UPI001D9C6E13|nr:bifunctional glutamate N-acetyltransferase/amino-acid acetyltransferase ArgJ [Gordonibacter urolithinfaciens]HJF63767.1 bifunctional glutamate N-acetyltransferase/amino-acid acetyltransferase ArgJ [Gordonibacter urolithinfaciens]
MTDTHAASAPSSTSSVAPLRAETAAQLPDTLAVVEGGGVTSARGFRAAGVHAGFRKDPNRFDLALVAADKPCACAAVFTQNVFCAAPVTVSREHLEDCGYGIAQAVVVNSGNANAATGERGLAAARETAAIASDVLGCAPTEVLVASTGVIGEHLPLEPFATGIPLAALELSVASGGANAARAIMTTDTRPKEASVTFSGDGIGYDGCTFTVGGMAKGSGMIMPNMATMIAVLTTDAPVRPDALHAALSRAAGRSFNKVTVDSDTSTNDSCFLFSNGGATSSTVPFHPGSPALARFEQALEAVCQNLARQMAADGEGATRLVTVNVTGAATPADADAAARAVANSPLVKTAVYGHDANWGRVAMAIGKSGAAFRQEDAAIDIMGLPVCRGGLTVPFDEDEALRRFENPEIAIDVDLGAGDAATTVWTCDFSHDYVTINGDYRS